MKTILTIMALIMLAACEIVVATPEPVVTSPTIHTAPDYGYTSYYQEVCYEEMPYYSDADYCEYYSSGSCCEWYSYSDAWDHCYEEWCVWDDVCGWEYYDTNCYAY